MRGCKGDDRMSNIVMLFKRGMYWRILSNKEICGSSQCLGRFRRIWESFRTSGRVWQTFTRFWQALEPSAEAWKGCECFGMLGRGFKRLGVSVEEGIGAFG